jgi:hypothetical protein
MTGVHPAMKHLHTFPVWSDERRNAEKMLAVYEDTFDQLAELAFGAPEAYPLLRDQADRLAAITQHCGAVHGWTLQQHGRIRSEANRLLPGPHEFNSPTWSE